jgi:hypothetical protein
MGYDTGYLVGGYHCCRGTFKVGASQAGTYIDYIGRIRESGQEQDDWLIGARYGERRDGLCAGWWELGGLQMSTIQGQEAL